MSTVIRHKRGTSDPYASDFSETAELLINTSDGGLFTKTDGGSVVEVGSAGVTDTSSASTSIGLGSGALDSETNGNWNTAFGVNAATDLTSGNVNVAVGYNALKDLTTGGNNVAVGFEALGLSVTGVSNTALGRDAGKVATNNFNTFVGYGAGKTLTTGSNNTLIGKDSAPSSITVSNEITLGNTSIDKFRVPGINFILKDNSSLPSAGQVLTADSSGEGYWDDAGGVSDTSAGSSSFGLGPGSFDADSASNSSTAFGKDALKSTTTGWKNTAVGTSALQAYNGSNVQGSNTAVGYRGLYALTTGQQNTAIGEAVLQSMTTTSMMTAVGSRAGINATGSKCTFVGRSAGSNSTGSNNLFLGYNAQPSTASVSNEVTIGDTVISKFRIPGINFILKDNSSLPSTGQVLTADSSGEGYWATLSGLTDNSYHATSLGVGTDALISETATGNSNAAFGTEAGKAINTGDRNCAFGYRSLLNNVGGLDNTGLGNDALGLATGNHNTGVGSQAGDQITTGINNTCIGYEAQPSSATVSNEITLGSTSVSKFRVPGINFILKDNSSLPSTGQVLTADSSGEGYWADNVTSVTNNNQLTNGAGYISSFDITTQTDSKYLRSNADDTATGDITFNGVVNIRSAIDLADNDKLILGSGDDAELFCDGSHLYLQLNDGIGNFYIKDNNETRFTFDDNGDFTATGNVTAYSDITLKKNIEVIPNALDKVMQLRGVTFDRKDIETSRQAGVIAQEVEKVLPEVVDTNEEGIKSVAYGNLVGLLIEAVKEQQIQIKELKTLVNQK